MRLTVDWSAFTNAPVRSTWSGAVPACSVASPAGSLTALPQPSNVGVGSAAPAGPMATSAASTAARSVAMYLMAALTSGRARTCVVGDPRAEEAAEMREEALVLVGRIGRADGLDEQRVELVGGDPVVGELGEVGEPRRAEVVVALGLEVLVGQPAVGRELVLVGE